MSLIPSQPKLCDEKLGFDLLKRLIQEDLQVEGYAAGMQVHSSWTIESLSKGRYLHSLPLCGAAFLMNLSNGVCL